MSKSLVSSLFDGNWITRPCLEGQQERLLLLSFLDRNVRDVTERCCKHQDSVDAAEWFVEKDPDPLGFGFVDTCMFLDLDPSIVLSRIAHRLSDLVGH